ncbi:MAG: hypothetical protein CMF41_00300 [Legionellales bacterium]|nr:hypothetical protein [Legionellales bacterium]OUX66482.1 MAG: hypothetical protein CBE41_00220 [Gammaproteobacteria bacterium TMED281]
MIVDHQQAAPSYLPFLLVLGLFLLAFGFLACLHQSTPWMIGLMPGLILVLTVSTLWIKHLLRPPFKMNSRSKLIYGIGLTSFALFILWFAYLQVPLFHLVCHRFGIHGGVEHHHQSSAVGIDYKRSIPFHFTTLVMQGMPCTISLDAPTTEWHPGAHQKIGITIDNPSEKTLILHPILSASPERASLSLHFNEGLPDPLRLSPHQSFHQDLNIHFDADFPNDIVSVFLSISLSNATNAMNPGKQPMWRDIRNKHLPLEKKI